MKRYLLMSLDHDLYYWNALPAAFWHIKEMKITVEEFGTTIDETIKSMDAFSTAIQQASLSLSDRLSGRYRVGKK